MFKEKKCQNCGSGFMEGQEVIEVRQSNVVLSFHKDYLGCYESQNLIKPRKRNRVEQAGAAKNDYNPWS